MYVYIYDLKCKKLYIYICRVNLLQLYKIKKQQHLHESIIKLILHKQDVLIVHKKMKKKILKKM